MPTILRTAVLGLLFAACAGQPTPSVAPRLLALPDSTTVLDPTNGAAVDPSTLLRRMTAADFVLLGELHDNPWHHRTRGALITALGDRHPAIVFEQFASTERAIEPPAAETARETWLDQHGFDRQGWKWPLHQPVVEAALAHGRSLWGSGVSREALRNVVRTGAGAAPEPLQALLLRAPLDGAARDALDQELIDGHCGKLPDAMIPGMRTAQVVRDAAMTRALLLASSTGPAWLIAGNGHVRRDVAVPRLLRSVAAGRTTLVVGLLEREPDGRVALVDGQAARYDLVIVTPRAARTDPCAGV